MTIATAIGVTLFYLCLSNAAHAEPAQPVFACNLKAINAADRPRYNALVNRIRAAIHDRREISSGYVFSVDGKRVTLIEAAEWVTMERLCCPFLTLQLTASGKRFDWHLTLTGPTGVKSVIATEFPAP